MVREDVDIKGRRQIPSSKYKRFTETSKVMDYDEACFMHLTPGVVHNFPKAVGV